MDAVGWINGIIPALGTIVAIGWSVEKILRLVNTLLPASVTIDDDIAEFLGRMLKMVGGIVKKDPK